MSLRGKCALVTGSTQGLGLAVARRFAAEGCQVVLSGLVPPDEAARLGRDLEDRFGVRTLWSPADLRSPDDIGQLMASAEGAFGGIDVLVNNAVVRHGDPVEAFPVQHWNEGLAVNLSAAFHTIRLALPGMRRRGWGRIINVSSIYGLVGAANRVAYVTTKTALLGLTRAVALELAGTDITCNAVCPGTTLTPVHDAAVRGLIDGEGLDRSEAEGRVLNGKQPSGRFITAAHVAELIVFLCGPGSGDITGAALPIDGGWSAS